MITYAFSDIHGRYDLWAQIKNFIPPLAKTYFLGDAIDRGPDGFKIMNELLNKDSIIYLKGNHEYMMEKALRELKRDGQPGEAMALWYWNGGYVTYQAWVEAGKDFNYINILHNLPTMATYTNPKGQEIIMTHSGSLRDDEYNRVWNRSHFKNNLSKDDNRVIIHGHTPTIYLTTEYLKIPECYHTVKYANEHKIDIDCGCFFTNEIDIINLNDFNIIDFIGDSNSHEIRNA